MQPIQVYLDLPAIGSLLGWVQDATLLWMVAQISSVKVSLKRLLLGGMIGGLFQFVLLTNQVSGGLINAWVLSPYIFLMLVPLIMVVVTFYPMKLNRLIRVFGYFYLISLLLAGIHWGLDSFNQRFTHWEITLCWRFLLHLTLIFLLGELGWGVVHRKLWDRLCLYPIQIDWDGQQLKVNALLDTGNRLHDPLTKVPVVIIELNQIKSLLPEAVIKLIEDIISGNLIKDFELPTFWEERVRILPFNSIGREHGLLVGFRPDQLKVWQEQQEIVSKNVVVALCNKPLSLEGAFHALIPPTVLQQL